MNNIVHDHERMNDNERMDDHEQMDDCAEAREFVNVVISRETQLREDLYNEIASLKQTVQTSGNKLTIFKMAFGNDVGLFPPPLCPRFVDYCRKKQYDEIRARSNYMAYGRGILSVLYFERVMRTHTQKKGFFTYEDVLKVLDHVAEHAVITISGGVRFTWANECLVVHEQH